MVEWLKDMDWALFVAVLSLLFTGVVSFITIRYTKKSLKLTEISTFIAEKSLKAAEDSIKTSLELYEKQKQDDDDRKIKGEDREKNAIRNVVAIELARICDVIVKMYELKSALLIGISRIKCKKLGKTMVIMAYDTSGERMKDILIHSDANEIPAEVIMRSAVLCNKLYFDISDVKLDMSITNKQLEFCYDYINEEDVSSLSKFLNQSGTSELFKQMHKTMTLFSRELAPYKAFETLCEKIQEDKH